MFAVVVVPCLLSFGGWMSFVFCLVVCLFVYLFVRSFICLVVCVVCLFVCLLAQSRFACRFKLIGVRNFDSIRIQIFRIPSNFRFSATIL